MNDRPMDARRCRESLLRDNRDQPTPMIYEDRLGQIR